MAFGLSQQSLSKLQGVHPDLQRVVKRAIRLTEVDFRVTEGRRTLARQKELVAAGASQTLKSRHITGHAIDLVALIDFDGDGDKDARYDFGLYPQIAGAFRDAAKELGIPIRWGGCWQEINGIKSLNAAVADYVAARRAAGRKAFIDAVHFELPARVYP